MAEHGPRSSKSTPEWVGEGDARRDVAGSSDRSVAILALDIALRDSVLLTRQAEEIRRYLDSDAKGKEILMKELPNLEQRIRDLERERRSPDVAFLPPPRAEMPSSHEWDEMLVKAGQVLSQRVKDPKDRLDSSRAREIAKEVIDSAKTADDARAFRSLKSKGWSIAYEVAKWIVAAGVGAAAAHYGLRGH